MSRKVVITCALTGSQDTCSKNPAVPATPEEIAQSATDAANAGASVVHIHVRDPETKLASMEERLYAETVERIKDAGTNVIVNLTTGPGARYVPGKDDPAIPDPTTTLKSPAERVKHVLSLRPPICTLDVASFNFGEQVFVNTPEHLREMGSMITAAISEPRVLKSCSRPSSSSRSQTRVRSAKASGTPAEEGSPKVTSPEPASTRRWSA